MAVFVLGAGATRGASFVDPSKNACLPPLDTDFYAQLQRIRTKKHERIIKNVIQDTVDLFGVNFNVTMETVFTTLEHILRMVHTTGESRDFKRDEIGEKQGRLMQSIAATLEEALCPEGYEGTKCAFHAKLVEALKAEDEIISFNYDCLIDETLKRSTRQVWNARYGYGFNLGQRGANLSGDDHWMPKLPANKSSTVKLYKLHGSLHFHQEKRDQEKIKLKRRPYTTQFGNLRFTIIPPESNKRYEEGIFKGLWYRAGQALHRAATLVVIGYSFPTSDLHATALFRVSTKREALRSLVLVNPDREARRRARDVLRRGLSNKTRVLVFDTFKEFAAVDRSLWDA
jgi:SIR2-like domain